MKYFLLSWILLFIASCAGTKKTDTAESIKPTKEASIYEETFDPLSLNDDDITIIEKKEQTRTPAKINEIENLPQVEQTIEKKEVDGWRVQILATGNIESATLIHQEALDQFELSEINAYLIFEAPLYKVRIGDATDQSTAQTIRDLARDYGYAGAFIVRSKVVVQTEPKEPIQ
jgi:hypothetical protein